MDKKYIATVILITLGLIFYLIFLKTRWTGFYYPEEGNLIYYIKSDTEFNSLDSCRSWVLYEMVPKYNPSKYGYDYECGSNCRLSNSGNGLYICDKTQE